MNLSYVERDIGFIKADQNGLEVYFHVNPGGEMADSLKVNQRVSYHLAFTLLAPWAYDVAPLLL
jgi:cold shock CspA family protein